ncbi:MAG: hypothetical protein LJE95_11775 [Acidobacteria bacterium]|nr:hypothetical protein [Acidobacteriota bacterium]
MTGHDPVIPAGGSGKLVATISTHSNQQGKIRKAVRVETDDPGARILMLTVTAELQPPIEIQPRPPVSIAAKEGERIEKRLLLHRHDGKPLEVTKVVSRDPNLVMARVDVVKHEERVDGVTAEPGDVWLDLTVPGRRGTSFATTQVSVASTTPNLPLLMIPVYVRIRQLVEVIPPQARVVLPPQGGASLVRLVQLRNTKGREFKILSATSSHPDLFSVGIDSSKAMSKHVIRIEVSSKAAQERLDQAMRGQVELRTDIPERPTLTIPVEIMRVRAARRPTPGVIRGIRGSRVPTPVGGTRLKGGPPGTPTPVGAPVAGSGPAAVERGSVG